MPTRMNGSDNFRFDRYVRGVGRIQNSSGTPKLGEFRRRDAILTKLIEGGHLETLRLLKNNRLSIKDLLDADRLGHLREVADTLRTRRALVEAVEEWLPTSAAAKMSRARYCVSWRKFLSTAQRTRELGHAPTVEDLASIDYQRLRGAWSGSGSDWNRARAMISAFLSAFTRSRHSRLRLEVMDCYPEATENEAVMPDATAADFWRIVAHAPPHARPSFVAMAVLGAAPGEYLKVNPEDLCEVQHTVLLDGKHTGYRRRKVAVDERLWPWIVAAVPSQLQYRWLNVYWRRACKAAGVTNLRMYDLRHLSAQFAADRGATDRDLTIHLGHSNPQMSHRYSKRPVARQIAQRIADELTEATPNLEIVA